MTGCAHHSVRSGPRTGAALAMLLAVAVASAALSGAGPRFYEDDPISRVPESQDASKVTVWESDLLYDLSLNTFARPGDPTPDVRAKNLNTVDEVPDSSWFVNRIVARPLGLEELRRGPAETEGPAPGPWTIVRSKEIGAAPGFTARDSRGRVWFISFDSPGYPEAATGAIMVANKIFWALGYWQVENHLASIRLEDLSIAESATIRVPSGKRRKLQKKDLEAVMRRAARNPDGSYRVVAGLQLPGKYVGNFRYHGTRSDDPNDLVPHEHRRELRALKVFGAWTNLVDLKAGNTVDTLVQENGRTVVRHWLQDVGSTFGIGANGPREWDEGWEYLYEGSKIWKRLLTMGFYFQPWLTADYEEFPSIGRFEGDTFDPTQWKSRVPSPAVIRARADDTFWAARRVMAFTDEMVREVARAAAFSDPNAERHLADVLIKRRDRIGRAYLPAVNPLVEFALDAGGTLTFTNAAVEARVADAPTGGYTASWFAFDNATGQSSSIGAPTRSGTPAVSAPGALPSAPGAFVKIQVSAVDPARPSWAVPVGVFFRRTGTGWKLVGLERLP